MSDRALLLPAAGTNLEERCWRPMLLRRCRRSVGRPTESVGGMRNEKNETPLRSVESEPTVNDFSISLYLPTQHAKVLQPAYVGLFWTLSKH